jgi:hypothetical protein
MKLRNTVLIGAAVAMAAMLQTAQASVTLGSLVSGGGTLTTADGTLTFSGFNLIGDAGLLAQADNLSVDTTKIFGVDYLRFAGASVGLFNSVGIGVDMSLFYTVTAHGVAIVGIDQTYNPGANHITDPLDQISISETAFGNGGPDPANSTLTLQPLDLSDPTAEITVPADHLALAAATVVVVEKDIFFTSDSPLDTVSLSILKQSFHTVPEPTTMLAGALLLLPFGASTLRILRRNRMS